ncbi:MAG: hypothetical protein WD810_07070 [Solirubrobacterales bacterium]
MEGHFGTDFPAGVRAAAVRYARKLKTGRMPLAPPRVLPDLNPRDADVAVELTVDADDEAALERQALRCGTTVGRLVVHAVLVYLAELEVLGVRPRDGAGRDPGPAG